MEVQLTDKDGNILHKFQCLAVQLDGKYGKALNCHDYTNYDKDNERNLYKPELGSGDITLDAKRYFIQISDR